MQTSFRRLHWSRSPFKSARLHGRTFSSTATPSSPKRGDSIVGFCSVGPVRDADLDDSQVGEIYALYVEPRFWRSGVGSALCSTGLAHLRDKNLLRVTLWVLADNSLGRRFYEKFGFTEDGHSEPYVAGDAKLTELRYTMSL
jgi:ribosomal protein S18 acetylase RimI-like enzyme